MNIKNFILVLCIWIGLPLLVSSCAVNPVTGKQELMLLSESDEVRLGRETDAEIVKHYGIYEETKLSVYLNGIGQRLAKVSHRPQLDYQFKIIDSSVVNAFAVPGGYVYFSRGILAVLNNEAELSSVMGHEIGHITARHSAKQYSKAQLAQLGLGVGSIFVDSSLMTSLAQLGVSMLFLKFSRDYEREADRLGVEYASKAGYDASQLANFFETLNRLNPGSDRSGLPGWFSTHPSPEDRIPAVRATAKEWQQRLGLKDLKINRDIYLKEIDGLIYGDDPRQGYVDENIFFHPQLRFQFPVPPKWKFNNKRSQVEMVNEAQDAVILFFFTDEISSREAARKFISKTGAITLRSESVSVNGLPSQRLVSDIRTQKGTYRLLSYFIEKDRKVFVFHGLTYIERFGNHSTLFDHTMRQFKDLTDPRKIHVKP
ncbi:MAG: M48 family metalloprotease, partial [Thermodesulfobacteriota bacterium]